MGIFSSETELREVLDQSDTLISDGLSGKIPVYHLQERLGHLHSYYALDGHESDEEETALLKRYHNRIQRINHVLGQMDGLCSDIDATKPSYIEAGRFGSAEALRRLRATASPANIRT